MWNKEFSSDFKIAQLGDLFICSVMLGFSVATTILIFFSTEGLTFKLFGVIMCLFWFKCCASGVAKMLIILDVDKDKDL